MHPIYNKLEHHYQNYEHPNHQDTYRPRIIRDEDQEGHKGDGGQQNAEGGNPRGYREKGI